MEANNIRRTIHTDTFTPKSQAILEALRQYMLNRWGSTQMARNAYLSEIAIEPNGEIVWQVASRLEYDGSYCRTAYYERSTFACRRDDQKVRDWIALSMKHIIYTEFKRKAIDPAKRDGWKRKNDMRLDCLSTEDNDVTVAEAYCLFDRLLNRKTFAKRWKKPMLKEIVGEERDAVATELELARREESKKLDDKFEADKKALKRQKSEEINKMYAEIDKKYEALQTDLKAAYLQSKKDLDNALSFAVEGNPFA